MKTQLTIDNLDLDLRGISPADAETAARLLAPALARSLSRIAVQRGISSAPQIDAGHVKVAPGAGPAALATAIVRQIASPTRRGN